MAKPKLPWSPIRDLMKEVGAQVVARDAVDLIRREVEDVIKEVAKNALTFTRHAKRTKVSRDDVDLAIKQMRS